MEQKEKDSKRFITPAGAGLAAICFFLPWVRACGQDISGAQIANHGESALWLVLIAAIAIVGGFFIYEGQNNLKKLKPLAVVGALLSLLILLIKYAQVKGEVEIQYGAVGTLIGFIASLFGLQFLEDSVPNINKSLVVDNAADSALEVDYSKYVCDKCGTEVPVGEVCPKCKSESNITESDECICGKCGARVSDKDRFCSSCGAELSEAGGYVCSDCGGEVSLEDKKCPKCGKSLTE
jgi:ribosomal protein L40E/uncharacterized protein (DUF983 family)